MVKEFALIKSIPRLHDYLASERYNLDRMKENERVTPSLLETKVNRYNSLVDALNDLVKGLTGADENLFDRYVLELDVVPESDSSSGEFVVEPETTSSDSSSTHDLESHEEQEISYDERSQEEQEISYDERSQEEQEISYDERSQEEGVEVQDESDMPNESFDGSNDGNGEFEEPKEQEDDGSDVQELNDDPTQVASATTDVELDDEQVGSVDIDMDSMVSFSSTMIDALEDGVDSLLVEGSISSESAESEENSDEHEEDEHEEDEHEEDEHEEDEHEEDESELYDESAFIRKGDV